MKMATSRSDVKKIHPPTKITVTRSAYYSYYYDLRYQSSFQCSVSWIIPSLWRCKIDLAVVVVLYVCF